MSDLFWLNDKQIARLKPFFPKSHRKSRVDSWRVLSRIINRNGYAPKKYGSHKMLYNRWSDKGSRPTVSAL
jgi:hypothetical protein